MQPNARDHARSYHLHRLATALDTEGFDASVKTSYPAALHVFMPGASRPNGAGLPRFSLMISWPAASSWRARRSTGPRMSYLTLLSLPA